MAEIIHESCARKMNKTPSFEYYTHWGIDHKKRSTFGYRLENWLWAYGCSKAALARLLNRASSTVSDWCSKYARSFPNEESCHRFEEEIGVHPDEIANMEADWPEPPKSLLIESGRASYA